MPSRRFVPILALLVKLLYNHFNDFTRPCGRRYMKLKQQKQNTKQLLKQKGHLDACAYINIADEPGNKSQNEA